VNEPASDLRSAATSTDVPVGTETILIAEDESLILGLAAETLQTLGYRVLVANNGSEALQLAAETSEEIHLLVTDVVMPQIGGRELSRRLLALRPDLKILFVSGYTENSIVHHGILASGIAFLQKPYLPATLARKVRDVLDSRAQ
jgi:CheY-like chemotaxis protein